MVRSKIGFGMLIVLLILSIAVTVVMDKIHTPLADTLEQAAKYSLEENWEKALELGTRAKQAWEKWEHLRACFADHTPLEDIDAAFAEMAAWEKNGDPLPYAAACLRLAQQVRAVGDAHGVGWWNVL